MNLFELFVKIGVDDQASGKLKDLGGKLGNGLKTAAKIGTAAVGAAAAGITALTKAAVDNYAEYEQLVGGVETLFGKSADTVMKYAENAYKTAGLSANEYMATVTSFSASLLQSVGGDTDQAADYANRALTDMSDNANKMGTSMELIQNAYNGFAKANYTMLDNLKLGYGGTGEEMKRLIADAAALTDVQKELGITVDATDMSFGNIVNAISVVQKNMKITGTTADEAGRTIAGSVQSMKSAWTNLVTGLADGNADIGKLIDNLVVTVVGDGTESNLGVLGNIMPAVKRALNGASKLVQGMLPKIVQEIPSIINDNLPILAEAAISIIQSLVDGISENQEMLMTTAFETITYLANSLISMLPQIVQLGLDLIVSLADGIAEYLPKLIPTIIDIILKIVDVLTQSDVLQNLIDSAFIIIKELSDGIMEATPELTEAIMMIIEEIVSVLLKPENLAKLITTAVDLILAITAGMTSTIPEVIAGTAEIIESVVQEFKNTDWKKVGKDVLTGLWDGIYDKVSWLKQKVTGVVDKIKGWFTGSDGFDTHSPSKWSAKVFRNVMDGGVVGLEDGLPDLMGGVDDVVGQVKDGMSIGNFGGGISYGHSSGFGGTSIGSITIHVDGAKYSDEQSLASAIALEIQNMTDRRAAVYA